MFAIIKTGGKQYRVAKDDLIKVEKLDGEEGSTITLDQVLLVGNEDGQTVGAPLVDGAAVEAEVIQQKKRQKSYHFQKEASSKLPSQTWSSSRDHSFESN